MSEAVEKSQLGVLGRVPVEIRHRIYHFVSLKETDFILKEWFEKIDPHIDTSVPVATGSIDVSSGIDEEDEDEESDGDEEDEEDEEYEEDEDEEMDDVEDSEDESMNGAETSNSEVSTSNILIGRSSEYMLIFIQGTTNASVNVQDGSTAQSSSNSTGDQQTAQPSNSMAFVSVNWQYPPASPGANSNANQGQPSTISTGIGNQTTVQPLSMAPISVHPMADTGDSVATTTTTTIPAATVAPVAPRPQRRTKYRHTVKMYNVDRAPPPINLLLVSPQISREAYNYVYNTAGITIDVTRNFAHMTFLEETLASLNFESSTPLNHLKKATVNFVWDTEWIQNNKTKIETDVLTNVLQARADSVKNLLLAMPKITDIKITWHDTEHTDEAVVMYTTIKDMFLPTTFGGETPYSNMEGTEINFSMEETFEEQGTQYTSHSRIGKLRTELEDIASTRVQIS